MSRTATWSAVATAVDRHQSRALHIRARWDSNERDLTYLFFIG